MGQMLSREDEEEHEQAENVQVEPADELKEKPKRRQRNNPAAARSRRPRGGLTQGRTRRNRTED